MFEMMPYAEQPRNATAVNILRSWLTAVGIKHKPSKLQGYDICVEGRAGGEVQVQVAMGGEEKSKEAGVQVLARDITGKRASKKLDAFWSVTDAAGFERRQPVDRGAEPEANAKGNPRKLHYRDEFDLVAFRHTEFRWSPDPPADRWVRYKPTIEKVAWGFLKMNSRLAARHQFDIDDVLQYARVWVVNYCARYEVPNPLHNDNERKCYRYLQQRFNNDLRALLLKKERSTIPDAETVSIALYGAPDSDPEVAWGWDERRDSERDDEVDPDYVARHCELDVSTPQARRRSAGKVLGELLSQLDHDQFVTTLRGAASSTSIDMTARKEASRLLRAHEAACEACGGTAAPVAEVEVVEEAEVVESKKSAKPGPTTRKPEELQPDAGRIPQANRLPMVRRLVEAVKNGRSTAADLAEACGFSTRQSGYYRQAATVLGFLDAEMQVTHAGKSLLKTDPCSDDETEMLRAAVYEAAELQPLLWFFSDNSKSVAELGAFLAANYGMADATALRRASGLNRWRQHLRHEAIRSEDFPDRDQVF